LKQQNLNQILIVEDHQNLRKSIADMIVELYPHCTIYEAGSSTGAMKSVAADFNGY
jgi:DNA-binding NarL/FixJ family response regulator